MHHHHHLLLIAKIAILAGAAFAVQQQRPGNGLVTPLPVHRAHPIVITSK